MFSSVIKALGSTLGACGDVNRNIMAAPAPFTVRPDYSSGGNACQHALLPETWWRASLLHKRTLACNGSYIGVQALAPSL